MQISTQEELNYIADNSECALDYMAVFDEFGKECVLTSDMIDETYKRLLAQASIRHLKLFA